MKYRKFGSTGMDISALGFGCMRLPEYEKDGKWEVDLDKSDAMLRRAFDLGVNYYDSAPYYCNSNSEAAVGHGVKSFRSQVNLSTKIPLGEVKKASDYRRILERSLTRMDTDYIDYYHFWGLNRGSYDQYLLEMDLLSEARKAKEEGLIRHISFSFHDEAEVIRYIIDTSAQRGVPMESMLVQYNLLDRSNEEMLAYATSQGLGTVAMGPVAGGRLAAPTDLYAKLTGKAPMATYELAFKFVLGNPNLCCALSGMENLDMIEQNVKIAQDPSAFTEDECVQLAEAMEQLKKFSELYCTGCKYCQPCPAEIKIPEIFHMYTLCNVYGLKPAAKKNYTEYLKHGGKMIADCLDCGMCEANCPQHLKIRDELRRVETVLAAL